MGNYCYLEDAWHCFNSTKGELICVYDKDKMVAIGRFTVLADNSAWLETLRVIPEYQNKGVGKLIYKEYLKLAKIHNCTSMAMFTGVQNKASRALAEKNGLAVSAEHIAYHTNSFSNINKHDFKNISWQKALELILPLKNEYNNYMVSNRTFYHINKENIMQFASEGKVYYSESDGSFIVCGSRFQHNMALHIILMCGNYSKCIDFAMSLASVKSVRKLLCTFVKGNDKLEKAFIEKGFEKDKSNLITMEIVF